MTTRRRPQIFSRLRLVFDDGRTETFACDLATGFCDETVRVAVGVPAHAVRLKPVGQLFEGERVLCDDDKLRRVERIERVCR